MIFKSIINLRHEFSRQVFKRTCWRQPLIGRVSTSVVSKSLYSSTSQSEEINNRAKDLQASMERQKSMQFRTVFRFPYIAQVAIFSRLKVYVTAVSVFMVPATGVMWAFSDLDEARAAVMLSIFLFSALTMAGMGQLFRKVVGFVYISEDLKNVRFAHMSFWGKRQDFIVPIDDIKLLLDTSEVMTNVYWKVYFYDHPEKYLIISTKYGGIQEPDLFNKIFGSP